MIDKKTIEIEDVGLVLFERSQRAKHIIISVRPLQGVRVAVPYSSSLKKAEAFVHTKKAWINRHLEKMKQHEQKDNYNPAETDYIDETKARKMLAQRLESLASKFGFCYNRVFIRNQRTRWDSCSSKNNISLNIKLVRLPEELVDYVMLHELVHTRIKNHSKFFWQEMDKLVGAGKQIASRLRVYGVELY
ncbi:MAG: M48 family metallopeptidase [Dehalococcoidales bacterium]|nr:M48 family metallopeptidase [Dehalococcoidales bacterium]